MDWIREGCVVAKLVVSEADMLRAGKAGGGKGYRLIGVSRCRAPGSLMMSVISMMRHAAQAGDKRSGTEYAVRYWTLTH